jgi:hypothetical protein
MTVWPIMGGMETLDLNNDAALRQAMQTVLESSPDVYVQLNALRDWVNARFPTFDFYLEDVWNEVVEGETRIEYILRSRRTLNETDILGYDIYHNHRDAKGVWHLDDYIRSTRLLEDPQVLVDFINANRQ